MEHLGISLPTLIAQIINWLILAAIIAVSVYFVGRDAWKRGRSWPETAAWTLVSVAIFPIGFGLYFLLRRRKKTLAEYEVSR